MGNRTIKLEVEVTEEQMERAVQRAIGRAARGTVLDELMSIADIREVVMKHYEKAAIALLQEEFMERDER